ncbi:FIST signal transduction protein [Robiginitalea sp. IMCC43444]|uniref:FIST signal transduction protein n=1 Tax=Robiginitalea sp. IMCC43444 TaxID=3459121 RepID=UPI00404103E3
MQRYQTKLTSQKEVSDLEVSFNPDILFLFVSPTFPDPKKLVGEMKAKFPDSILFGCSTAGEIMGNEVFDSTAVLTAVKFEKALLRTFSIDLEQDAADCFSAGRKIYLGLEGKDLRHIFVLSDGLNVNGADLVSGLQSRASETVSITGGLAADGSDFGSTFLIHNGEIKSKQIIALGFYGEDLKIGYGSKGGWDSFGIERLVTRSDNNVLYELDGQPALDLYKEFLGDKAKDLPGSGLLFPLSMRDENNKIPVVRTILAVDEEARSLTFAGNIPQGSYVRLMKANIDRIIDGAEESARITKSNTDYPHELAFLISCVGRRLVMKQLVEEEIEAVNEVLGEGVITTGFYSYGEIAPFDKFSPCTLHNQTMTITTISE